MCGWLLHFSVAFRAAISSFAEESEAGPHFGTLLAPNFRSFPCRKPYSEM